jgi:hypothetical protein
MNSLEYGGRFNPGEEEGDDEAEETLDELEDRIAAIESECNHVYANPDNADKLGEIFEVVSSNYEKEPKEWNDLLSGLKSALTEVDGEDVDTIAQILDNYERKAKQLA